MQRHEGGTFIFIGKDRSMGLRKWHLYKVVLTFRSEGGILARISGNGIRVKCPYETLRAFMRNWALAE